MIYGKDDMKRYGEAVVKAAAKANNDAYGGLFRAEPEDLDAASATFQLLLEAELKKLEATL